MKKRGVFFSTLIAVLLGSTIAVNAQQQAPLLIGVIDLPSIFQQHPVVVDDVPRLQEVAQKDAAENGRVQQAVAKEAEKLKTQFRVGTPEYEQALRPLRDQVRDAEIKFQEQQNQVLAQLSKMQYRVLTDIQTAVQTVAEQKGIIIVHLRLKTDRKDIAEEVAALQDADRNTVVWCRPECDVTNDVIGALRQRVGVPKTGPGGPLGNITGGLTPSGPTTAPATPGAAGSALMGGQGGGLQPAPSPAAPMR